jgi:hypothetical protein
MMMLQGCGTMKEAALEENSAKLLFFEQVKSIRRLHEFSYLPHRFPLFCEGDQPLIFGHISVRSCDLLPANKTETSYNLHTINNCARAKKKQ